MQKNTPSSDSLPSDGNLATDLAHEAAFSGALVNLKNVATHKSVALTIEVPEEYAAALVASFGWPTRVRPVPVAVARLAGEAATPVREKPKKEHWAEMDPSKQAAILCQEEDFQDWIGAVDEDDAAKLVRAKCSVESRKNIVRGAATGHVWDRLMIDYGAWLRGKRG